MRPYYADEWLTVYQGDCRDVLPTLSADSVDCVVTSPPYWGLRDYGQNGQLGLEPTPEEYVANLVAVFREVRRVLKPSGTCWLNLGDSYSVVSTHKGGNKAGIHAHGEESAKALNGRPHNRSDGLKPKDLVGIPWRVAFALQADGWYLRSDIIWSKPNPMPESVTDRPTKAHEYLFLLTKSARYFYDADAVREAYTTPNGQGWATGVKSYQPGRSGAPLESHKGEGWTTLPVNPAGRNLRSVWTIATRPYADAHFAVFPPELPERCIKAGSSERGVCPECGAPWERVVISEPMQVRPTQKRTEWQAADDHARTQLGGTMLAPATRSTTGWHPTCDGHPMRDGTLGGYVWPEPLAPAVVLDPFAGSGTVGQVANRLSRRAILIDLNPAYLRQQMQRNAQTPLGLAGR